MKKTISIMLIFIFLLSFQANAFFNFGYGLLDKGDIINDNTLLPSDEKYNLNTEDNFLLPGDEKYNLNTEDNFLLPGDEKYNLNTDDNKLLPSENNKFFTGIFESKPFIKFFEFIFPNNFPTIPPTITKDFPAVWEKLNNVEIQQGSPDNTLIYKDIKKKCVDPDDEEKFDLTYDATNYELFFFGDHLLIKKLNPAYVGSKKIIVTCNKVNADFTLKVKAPEKEDDDNVPAVWNK
jgi:hypothetical protein